MAKNKSLTIFKNIYSRMSIYFNAYVNFNWIFSYIIRSFSLAIRLSANIMAGHTLVFIISSFVLNITKMKWWLYFIGFSLLFLVLCLELGVAFLQAYVFTVLVTIYINDVFNTSH